MPKSKKRKIRATEETNQNLANPYEALVGPGLAPYSVDEEDFEDGDRPRPTIGDPFHGSYVLVPASRRLDRIARQMIRNGFLGGQ
jgi:hypothetical protein